MTAHLIHGEILDFDYIDNEKKLKDVCKILEKSKVLGFDLECENNLHSYGVYISLFQISDGNNNWIVDAISLKEKKQIQPLLGILENKNIQKIFHDVNFDFRVLSYQYDCKPKNIYDTQVAAVFLGKDNIGLGSLLQDYFDIKKEKKFQMADWSKRPIRKEMLAYAIKDSIYLIKLKDVLNKELKECDRYDWVLEEQKNIDNKEFVYKKPVYTDLRGVKQLEPREAAIAKRLFELREYLAKKTNKPSHFIMNSKKIMELAKKPIKSIREWRNMRGVHPIVKNYANKFVYEINQGEREEIVFPRKKRINYTQEQKKMFENMNSYQEKMESKLGIKKHLVISKDQIQSVVLDKNLDSLLNWQKKVFDKYKPIDL
jgi:ribonuclease D